MDYIWLELEEMMVDFRERGPLARETLVADRD